jgi:NAD(P)-dependent dehydrogenase (short-subunit alcohol dehydrogenase family)
MPPQHIIVSGKPAITHRPEDAERPDTFASALDAAVNRLGAVDLVVVTAGLFAKQDVLENDLNLAGRLLATNFVNTVLFCEHVRQRVFAARGGVLCVFSSVAGERGRKPVVLYGAAKSGLTRYLEGLDHRFHSAGLRVVCVKPGFVRTSMTQGLKEPPFSGEPELVATQVLRAIEKGQPVVYAPSVWALIMLVVRWLPRFVLRREGNAVRSPSHAHTRADRDKTIVVLPFRVCAIGCCWGSGPQWCSGVVRACTQRNR